MKSSLAIAAVALFAAIATPPAATRALAQSPVGGVADDERRAREVLGDTASGPTLVRRTSAWSPGARDGVSAIPPSALAVYNTDIASGGNDGALWAGRGASVLARIGVAARWRWLRVVALPEVTHAQNRAFPVLAGRDSARSMFASPWHAGRYSADLPLRFGDQPVTTFSLGQSSVTVAALGVAAGLATDAEWWGPGVENALVMSNNAAGVPRAFVGTDGPVETPLGTVEARLAGGVLTESLHFNDAPGDDFRSHSGVVATIRPRFDPRLTLGVERVVVAPISGRRRLVSHALDQLVRWDRQREGAGGEPPTSLALTGVFGRWLVPSAGVELYGEWTRNEFPRSVRDFLLAPQYTQAYTLGLGRAVALAARRSLVVRLELTTLEQSRVFADRPAPVDYYASASPAQGYTQRGQALGAAVGPGGSSQWASVSYVAPSWRAELFGRRERRENDALYRQELASSLRHDVTVAGGVRGVLLAPALLARAELAFSNRMNYLFQNGALNIGGVRTVDIHNLRLAIEIEPRARPVRRAR